MSEYIDQLLKDPPHPTEHDKQWENLAIAVVNSAANEYRMALRAGNNYHAATLKKFFHSDYGDMLCFGNGKVIERMLAEEVKNGHRQKKQKTGYNVTLVDIAAALGMTRSEIRSWLQLPADHEKRQLIEATRRALEKK